MKTVSIIQSNYIPWKGYFDIINDSDLFVFYDDVQYTKNDWRNRNKIKTRNGASWLTIPVGSKFDRLIHEVEINDRTWQTKHWKTLSLEYKDAPYFNMYKDFFRYIYFDIEWTNLSILNQYLIKHISREFLGINTTFKSSLEFNSHGQKLDKLIDILIQAEADVYISGPAAKNYIDEKIFIDSGIKLVYKNYNSYPEYPQFHPPFEHGVTILDLLFQVGPEAPYYIWGWRQESKESLKNIR
ncbi:WbqC family protein [Paenibacillus sedimenti]|uniref:WbqC family protein n=1 Tax=Paenibacillus sedimenti TaxID=2770274 RepID=A0A926KMF6_9BACL|nr:WbqC family protein [Paenibacillus sedimenti]MBD0379696.1 WbqC family protein [Paenibacillus sedimenti]